MSRPASVRAALAALDDGALEAAASKGLLRRAHRDHEAGLAAVTREDGERAELAVDGETVALTAAGLAAAACSCPAQGVCRHILAAVIALRAPAAEAAEPAAPAGGGEQAEPAVDPVAELVAAPAADLVKAFGRAALRDAEAILAAAAEMGEPVAVEASGSTCLVRLPGQPEVRYLAGPGLAGMISREPAPLAGGAGRARRKPVSVKALHAAAVLALRRQHAGEVPESAEEAPEAAAGGAAGGPVPPRRRPGDAAFLDAVTAALAEAARSGLATAPRLVEERLLYLALSSRADAMPRLAGQLRGIAEDLSQRRDRVASFEPAAALAAMARCYALVVALRTAGDDPILRGAIRQPYAELPPLDLVGCGLELWRTATGARGATAHALVLGEGAMRCCTLTLGRAAGQDPFFVPRDAARAEPVFGASLEALSRGGFRLDGARATVDGRLSLGSDTRRTPGAHDLAALLDARGDLFVADWGEIAGRLAALCSPSLRQGVRSIPLLLRPAAMEPVQFDALAQRAWLPVMDRSGHWLDLTIGGDDDARLDAVVAMQEKGVPRALTVLATREGAEIVLSPVAAVGKAGLDSFDLHVQPFAAAADQRPRSVLDRLKDGLGALVNRPRSATFAPVPRPDAASAALLAMAEDEILALAELGGRMEDAGRLGKLGRIAGELDAAALGTLAGLLSRLAAAPSRERPLRLLAFKHAGACHAALSPRLPLVRRLS